MVFKGFYNLNFCKFSNKFKIKQLKLWKQLVPKSVNPKALGNPWNISKNLECP